MHFILEHCGGVALHLQQMVTAFLESALLFLSARPRPGTSLASLPGPWHVALNTASWHACADEDGTFEVEGELSSRVPPLPRVLLATQHVGRCGMWQVSHQDHDLSVDLRYSGKTLYPPA